MHNIFQHNVNYVELRCCLWYDLVGLFNIVYKETTKIEFYIVYGSGKSNGFI